MNLYKYENELYKEGISYIGGVDEVGRGPLIGPVVSACVVLPKNLKIKGLNDSKQLSEKKRNEYYKIIKDKALGIGIGIVDSKRIDKINIYEASKESMNIAINNCLKQVKIEHVLIDAMKLNISIDSTSIIKGDQKSISIAAASVIAKVTRDSIMYEIDNKHPEYDFKNNKGYPTNKHIEAINKYGILKEHRLSYKPVMDYINSKH